MSSILPPTSPVAETPTVPNPEISTPPITPEPQVVPSVEPKREPWFQKRIDELTRARREAERKVEALETLINSTGTPPPQSGAQTPQMTDIEIQKRAEILADNRRLNDEANRVYHEGKAKHADFDTAVNQLGQIADLSQKPEFLEAITRLPNGADIYHHLGTHPDQASEILGLRPTTMAIELAKISAELGRPKPGTTAPPPMAPIGSSNVSTGELSDDLPMAEWLQRREANLKKK